MTEDSNARSVFSLSDNLLLAEDPKKHKLPIEKMHSSLLLAPKLAKQSYAFDASYKYFSKAQSLIKDFHEGSLSPEQIMDGGICAYLKGEYAQAESLTKVYKMPILITEDTKNKLTIESLYEINAVVTVIAKGKTRQVIIYELKLNSA